MVRSGGLGLLHDGDLAPEGHTGGAGAGAGDAAPPVDRAAVEGCGQRRVDSGCPVAGGIGHREPERGDGQPESGRAGGARGAGRVIIGAGRCSVAGDQRAAQRRDRAGGGRNQPPGLDRGGRGAGAPDTGGAAYAAHRG